MKRRGFLGALAGAIVGAVVAPFVSSADRKLQPFVVTDAWPVGGLLRKGDTLTISDVYSNQISDVYTVYGGTQTRETVRVVDWHGATVNVVRYR